MTEFTSSLYAEAVGVARATARPFRRVVDADEAESVACVVIARAVRDYRPDRGVSLRTHVRCRVRNRMKDFIRGECRRSRRIQPLPLGDFRLCPVRGEVSAPSLPELISKYSADVGPLGRRAVRIAAAMVIAGKSPSQADFVRKLRSLGWSWTKIDKAFREIRRAK